MLGGFVAMAFRKGSRGHALAGDIFVISMLGLGLTGTYLAIMRSQPGNILGGTFTFYLVATAWRTASRRENAADMFDWIALLFVFALAATEVTFGLQAAASPKGLKYDYPPGPYFFIGSVAVLATIGDIRLLLRRGIVGTQRIARHLWRMCFAWFIASASIFLARAHVFPAFMRNTGMLYVLSFLPLILMFYWFIRVRYTRTFNKKLVTIRQDGYAVRA
jgi:hypothetical protein